MGKKNTARAICTHHSLSVRSNESTTLRRRLAAILDSSLQMVASRRVQFTTLCCSLAFSHHNSPPQQLHCYRKVGEDLLVSQSVSQQVTPTECLRDRKLCACAHVRMCTCASACARSLEMERMTCRSRARFFVSLGTCLLLLSVSQSGSAMARRVHYSVRPSLGAQHYT